MAADIGVTVVETDGRSAPAVPAAPVSVAGILVRAERGVADRPVKVRGFADFTAAFGTFVPGTATLPRAYGAHAVRGYFDNGGSEAYVVRVTGAGARPATAVLADRAATPLPTLRIRAGTRGSPDPGTWGNGLTVTVEDHPRGASAVPAQVIAAKGEPYALADGDTAQLQLTTRGSTSTITVAFRAADFAAIGTASAEEAARAVNRQTTAVRAAVAPGGRLALAAAPGTPGAWTRLVVTAPAPFDFTAGAASSDAALAAGTTAVMVDTASGFGTGSALRIAVRGHVRAAAAPTATVPDRSAVEVVVDGTTPGETIRFGNADFADPAAVTAAELAAAVNRQARAFTAELTHDNHLVLLSARYGTGSTIAVDAPAAGVTDARTALGLSGAVPVAGAEHHRTATAVSESWRLLAWDPTPALPAVPAPAARISSTEFDLVVGRGGTEVERFSALSMSDTHEAYAEAVVNDPASGSAYITVTDLDSASGPGLDLPAAGTFVLGATGATQGSDGAPPTDADFTGDPVRRTGLEAFTDVPIQLLACPETTSVGVVAACLAHCERRGDAMFVGTVPRDADREGAKAYAAALRGRKVFGALYAPWIDVLDPDPAAARPLLRIPPVGQVLGVYARIADARGVWKAPAGTEARLTDALGVQYDMTDRDHTDLVREGGVNGIRAVPGAGIVIDASRTLSTDTRWLFVGVRRLFNFVKASLRDGLTFVVQEPNTDQLRRNVRFTVVTPFLLGLWRQGAFGPGPADQVFSVKCDAGNNPPADVQAGLFTVEVLFFPSTPAESILVVVGQQDSAATAADN
ncbi:hypothetical protein [Streptomyces sp. NPDC059010]|uniref:hypothetical protein n=1 Tax=Streptomyces sp. NPDC059010 TaxID=3346695 RepID=UPI0036BCB46B